MAIADFCYDFRLTFPVGGLGWYPLLRSLEHKEVVCVCWVIHGTPGNDTQAAWTSGLSIATHMLLLVVF